MAKGNRRLHREVIRHTLASLISGAFALAVILATSLLVSGQLTVDGSAVAALTLAFGAYGPAFLWLSHLAFTGLTGDQLRARLRRSEEQNGFVRFLYVGGPKSWAMFIVFVGVISVVLLATRGNSIDVWLVATCVFGVAGSWVLLVAVFAVEHMRSWAEHDGLAFPGDEDRAFSDFVYLSIQLSTTFSTSDVALTNRPARSLASVQSIVGFAYSTVIIAVFASLLITLTV
ncbi:DUF1345 domain-containing protein [Agrococcus sp. ARC_14]|uniref:DUF1345 domain-containing protein n=1 Tax=Agrococcus sp. ARC_14 TaxID=2919927 RepID=UPI001F05147B|nr:DUF1345 domain-containing protein [Agrococcus sp. ARC_14]MCH1881825.1 DUF1345 domain-containing protein [Agrococcus sp. ARC_14]